MAVWVVRAGRQGEQEAFALEHGYVVIGWDELGDLSGIADRDALRARMEQTYGDLSPGRARTWTAQVWAFLHVIKKGDIVALPLKGQPAVAFGKVTGDTYRHAPDNPEGARHVRTVQWIGEPIPRTAFDSDLRYSFGAIQTVFSVWRNDAENRLRAMLALPVSKQPSAASAPDNGETAEPALDIRTTAAQQISDHIRRRFKGRRMEELVKAILEAKGYEAVISPKGADDGVDILAGRGAMGFDAPMLCVQVKSGDDPQPREVLDQLQGVMKKFNAQHGLLVSWGGFKTTLEREARRLFFQIRLWNDQKLVEELQDVYDKLPKEIQADIPLKRIWVLVDEG